ncbi:MAG: HAMP domain-containing histidine kinase [bacterium]|nr:HAMP domain-containing histidine kinase [bacterium]
MDFKKILFRTNAIDVEKALPDGVIFCSKDGKIEWVNDKAAEIFETSKINLKTSDIFGFIENALNLISNAIINDKAVIAKITDREMYFELTAKEIEEGYVVALRDVPQSRNFINNSIENEKPINRNKNNFLVKLSNDFKTPLQSIVGFSQAMADGLGGNMTEQQEKYIKIIKKNSSDLMYFLEKLTELSKTENATEQPEMKTFDILNLINSIVRYNSQLSLDKDIRWNVSMAEGMKNYIVSDENFIKSIVQNIIEVILKSVEMGEITIDISVPDEELLSSKAFISGSYLMISIKSSSLLLSETDLESMFDPYKIIDSPNRKNLLRAMTLGSVKNLVQALNGMIWVESKILKNTGFNIIFPVG